MHHHSLFVNDRFGLLLDFAAESVERVGIQVHSLAQRVVLSVFSSDSHRLIVLVELANEGVVAESFLLDLQIGVKLNPAVKHVLLQLERTQLLPSLKHFGTDSSRFLGHHLLKLFEVGVLDKLLKPCLFVFNLVLRVNHTHQLVALEDIAILNEDFDTVVEHDGPGVVFR